MGFLPIAAAAGSLIKGVGGFMAGQAQKKAAYAQGHEELLAGADKERRVHDEARRAIGEQLASQWGNGLEGGTGTALDAVRESKINEALDVMTLNRDAFMRNRSLRKQGKAAEREGYFSLASGLLGAATSAKQMSNDWAQARSGRQGNI